VLYLCIELRGLGIGTRLLDFVTDKQKRVGALEQWVSVTEGNDLGIPFYRAHGFVERDRELFVAASVRSGWSGPSDKKSGVGRTDQPAE
jgi:hypothetical protein